MLCCRWKKYEIHDIVIECAKVSLDPKEASFEEGYATMPENFYPQIHLRPQDCTSSPYTDLHSSYGSSSSTPFSTPRQPPPPPLSLPPFSGTQSSYRSPQTSRRQVRSSITPEHNVVKLLFAASSRTRGVVMFTLHISPVKCSELIAFLQKTLNALNPSNDYPALFLFFLFYSFLKLWRGSEWTDSYWVLKMSRLADSRVKLQELQHVPPILALPPLCRHSLGLFVMAMLSLPFYYWVSHTREGSGCFSWGLPEDLFQRYTSSNPDRRKSGKHGRPAILGKTSIFNWLMFVLQ